MMLKRSWSFWSGPDCLFISMTHLFWTSHMWISSIWPIDRILSGATTPGQSGLGRNGNERVPHIPQALQRYWSLTIGLFSVISRTSVAGGGHTPLQRSNQCVLLSNVPCGKLSMVFFWFVLNHKIEEPVELSWKCPFGKEVGKEARKRSWDGNFLFKPEISVGHLK